jgi:flagellar biosynthesis protein FlhG
MIMAQNQVNISNESFSEKPIVVSVLSGKGGVGKSVIAFNLAAAAAHRGKRSLIIDCDYCFGNIHILANSLPDLTLSDVIRDERLLWEAIIPVNDNLHFIPSPSFPDSEVQFDQRNLGKFLRRVKSLFADYEFIVIDTPTSQLEIISLSASVADLNLIIVNPELTSIADGYGLFKYLMVSGENNPACLLVNQVKDGTDYEYVYGKFSALCERFLEKVPLDGGYLVDDTIVIDSVRRQKSLIEYAPDSVLTEQFLKLCKLLTDDMLNGNIPAQINEEISINS